jgi:PIN domain nuclease of toxin-antitoxin system
VQLLLDTHALIWWLTGDEALSVRARAVISEDSNTIFVSAASVWEIATKHRLGKLRLIAPIAADVEGAVTDQGFIGLPISLSHGQLAGALPGPHRDPFDRMLLAQAILDRLILVSNERPFDAYGVARLW